MKHDNEYAEGGVKGGHRSNLAGGDRIKPNTWYTLRDGEFAEVAQVMEAPTVDAVPVVHGRWERCGGDLHSSGYAIFCSVCNKVHFVHRKYSLGGLTCKELFVKPKYCPSCGAVMECEE